MRRRRRELAHSSEVPGRKEPGSATRAPELPSMYVVLRYYACFGYACAIWMSVCIIVSAVWITLELAW